MNKKVKKEYLEPIPPGEVLFEDFIKPFGLSINGVAKAIDVPPGRISDIVNGKRAITADTALRLGRFFGVSPEIWIDLQADYELRVAQQKYGADIEAHITPLRKAA